MNHFHRDNLRSGIRESHQVPVQADWAYVLRKQARLILLPLFREVIVDWREDKTGKRPILTELAQELFRGFFASGSIRSSIYLDVEKIVSNFLDSLNKSEKAALGFYFLSNEGEVDSIYQDVWSRDETEETTLEADEQEVGQILQNCVQQLNREELIEFLMEELGEIENLISDVTPSDLFSPKIKIPTIEVQSSIAQVLQTSEQEINLLKTKAEKLREQKKGMMQQLLTGKKSIKL